MKMNKNSKKLISPETPNPPNLKNYHISFLDSCAQGLLNVTIILYYNSKPDNFSQLEKSLAKSLVQFYPLAGRYIKNDLMVDCSDQGAEFVTVEALDLELIGVIEKIDIDQLKGDEDKGEEYDLRSTCCDRGYSRSPNPPGSNQRFCPYSTG